LSIWKLLKREGGRCGRISVEVRVWKGVYPFTPGMRCLEGHFYF